MRNQRGNGKLGVFIWIAIMAAGIFAAVRIIPVKVNIYEFHDYCEKEARFSATRGGHFDAVKLKKKVLDKAAELGLPLDKKQVTVKRSKSSVKVKVKHEVAVDLAVYTWIWSYDETFESMRM